MENEIEEIWKETNIPGYFVSNLGGFRGRSGKPIKQQIHKNGYYVYAMYPEGRKGGCKCIKIHRLIAETFIPNPENKPFVNHIDGNKLNNKVENLEWCTSQENTIHAYKHGLIKILSGEDNPNSKLTADDVKWIREHYVPRSREFGTRALGRKFGVDHSNIIEVLKGKSYKNVK
jgi:hypothetical protein